MRGKKALINTSFAILQEIVAVICAFVLPRLILQRFGSTYNGITSSITQFLGCAVLLRAGIGGATRASLYKPLADNNFDKVSEIVSATNRYMKKIALILGGGILAFACIYPFLVIDEFEWLFSCTLFLIIGLSTFAETLFGITNLIILQADQKLYISSFSRIITTISNTIISIFLIKAGASIHLVKLGSAVSFCLYPIFLNLYVRNNYNINPKAIPDERAINQRWDAFFHQVANFVMNNTDVIILTAFVPMTEVSVYSVYNLVSNGIRKLVMNFTNGLEAAFGNMYASNEKTALKKNFEMVVYVVFTVATIVYTTSSILFLEFVSIYTKGIDDVNYIRPLFAYCLMVSQFFLCIRQPYQVLVQAAGQYKQTRNGAILEPILNIVISLVAVFRFGLIGVVFGTLAAILFRTIQYAIYVSNNLIKGTLLLLIKYLCISLLNVLLICCINSFIPIFEVNSYMAWIVHAFIVVSISISFAIGTSLVFNKKIFIETLFKFKRIIRH